MNWSIICAVFAVLNSFFENVTRLVTPEEFKAATGYDRLIDIEKYFRKNGSRFYMAKRRSIQRLTLSMRP
jgi:hypothetical protein